MEHLRTRLRRLLLLLLDALENREDEHRVSSADLRELMRAVGLDDDDLEELLQWSGQRSLIEPGEAWLSANLVNRASDSALRLMGQREDELVTVAAFGYLLRLVRTRQITAEQMESMMQFAQLVPEGPLSPGDLSPLLDRVVFHDPGRGWIDEAAALGRAH
ncbi:DUF494 family protein [bacterium]|jgi:uncharacterized protein Smg (DUF494 family)|nr:DUF494 family protein [bacterium]